MGFQENDASVSPRENLTGSFRKTRTGLSHNDLDSSIGRSLDGSFRMSGSVISGRSLSDLSNTSKSVPNSRRLFKVLKECARNLDSLDLFTQGLGNWVSENTQLDLHGEFFRSPFSIDELLNLDLALEGVSFKQLCRMPCSTYASDGMEGHYLAIEDFLHAIMNGLWRTFWHKSRPAPFSVSCPRRLGSKFYTVEKAASRGRLEELQGLALVSKSDTHSQVHWDQVIEFALFRPSILADNELKLSPGIICEALFFGVHILLARSLRKLSTAGRSFVYILVCDSTFGGVVKIEGDLSQLEPNPTDPYESVTEWIKCHAEVGVSPVDQVWNKLGNANWGDIGTLQVVLATFYSMVELIGSPKKSIASLASEHGIRLQKRKVERQVIRNGTNSLSFQPDMRHQGEIIEVDQPSTPKKQSSRLKLRPGEMLLVDDQHQGQKTFQIQDSSIGGSHFLYSAVDIDCPAQLLTLYVGAHPSKLEPCWEDMSLWYQVQRQTKVLNILKQKGTRHKCLPEKVASGRILHSGPCTRQSPGGRCDHPICGTPILVTSPLGEPLSFIVARDGPFRSEEAIRCCRDCLAALGSAASANVQHGDICPENIVRVLDRQGSSRQRFVYMATSWGRAVLEEKDSTAINLQFSSSYALQHGKLCPSSDAESLVYLLLFICGSSGMQQHDSIESALQWRERSWGKRSIQQQLSEVSPLLKAFADYVDSLSGTPYPVEYDAWLKRLSRAIDGSGDKGKMMIEDDLSSKLMLDDEYVAESSSSRN
ncbi:hypothetical protein LINPERPRIM_LOCUS19471 [Linum perenne]